MQNRNEFSLRNKLAATKGGLEGQMGFIHANYYT